MVEVRRRGLTVVTMQEIDNATKIVEELKTNDFTAPIVNLVKSARYDVYNQIQIEGYSIDEHLFKSMMDKVVVDH
jgi:methenyltetrahydromethanopterin cyclohydrolase